MYKIGFIGSGLQARRRLNAIASFKNSQVVTIASKNPKTVGELAQKYSLKVAKNWQEIVFDKKIDIVVVTTYPDSHAEISIQALKSGKHVLCEKPLAKNLREAEEMVKIAKATRKQLKCGFNHRFHPAVLEAKKKAEHGEIGELLYGRSVYGYCGRPGFEKEWRGNPKYCAGGILMEQGIHVIDLFRWFFGDFSKVQAMVSNSYWPISPLEDNAFAIYKTKTNKNVSMHTSMLQWKNTFLFELYGTEGYLTVSGLGGSYGLETLTYGKKDYFGPFRQECTEYRDEDSSWKREWEEFLLAVENKKSLIGSAEDGLMAMKLVEAAYRSSSKEKAINI
ncbi:MAG: Gfo/Idh/MocA family oxidoreductase [Patescibacteria group bacterium]|nr:Gfo/Idh/MocA family oxidoreductase [Patescibacteria group bacterium]